MQSAPISQESPLESTLPDVMNDVPIAAPKPTSKKPSQSKKGQHTGGKWSWTDEERTLLLEHGNEFDQALIGPGSFWGYRISELLSLKVDDVMDEHGYLRPFVVMPSERLKGGKPRVVKPSPPKPANHDADCPCNLCHRKPVNRRKPPDRKVPMGSAAPYIMVRLEALAKIRNRDGVVAHLYGRGIYLYESRKRDKRGNSKPISRQQGWHRLHALMQANGINPYLHGTHVLRKSSAVAMMKLTKDITVVRDWLCHASSATTDKYLKSDERALLAIAEIMGQTMLGKVA
jgi:integrase